MPRRRGSPSPLLSPPVLIILLPIAAFIVLFFTIPPVVTLTSQRLIRPNAVKKSWDWLNVFLVLFAILCGVFARKNDDDSASEEDNNHVVLNAPNVPEDNMMGFSERNKIYDPLNRTPTGNGVGQLRRSSSSYPDLRQESLWENGDDTFRFRFFDDFEISKQQIRRRNEPDHSETEVKVIPVDTFKLRSSTPPAPPPPPPPPAAQRKPRRTYRTVDRKEKVNVVIDDSEVRSPAPPPPPPPPPPPRPPPLPPSPVRIQSSEKKYGKFERRKSNAKEIAMVFASAVLYNQRKKKKKRKTNIYDTATAHSPTEQQQPSYNTTIPPPPPPPPPPPLPSSSVFHSLFKKGSKISKKIHSVSVYSATSPPPPPPPPPPISVSARSSKHRNRSMAPQTPPPPPPAPSRRRIIPTRTGSGRPPLPTKSGSSHDENVNSGCQSPLVPMPPPPPPPPFKMPELKFFVRGDFVKIQSAHSSRCGSPEIEDADPSSNKGEPEKVTVINGGDGIGPVFCPSPDVNMKADTFIARLRDEWRLEKMNSMKEKRRMG